MESLAEVVNMGLPPLQRVKAETRELEEERYTARMDIQAAILESDIIRLKSAVERAKVAGLSYWELGAATDVLLSHERRRAS